MRSKLYKAQNYVLEVSSKLVRKVSAYEIIKKCIKNWDPGRIFENGTVFVDYGKKTKRKEARSRVLKGREKNFYGPYYGQKPFRQHAFERTVENEPKEKENLERRKSGMS